MSPVSISLWVVVCRQVVSHSLHPLHRHLFLGKVGHHYTVAITVSVVVSPILFFPVLYPIHTCPYSPLTISHLFGRMKHVGTIYCSLLI